MTKIPIQLDENDLKKIDYLVKRGMYKNRSHAIRSLLNQILEQETIGYNWESLDEVEKRVKIVEKLKKAKTPLFVWNHPINASNYIRNMRDER